MSFFVSMLPFMPLCTVPISVVSFPMTERPRFVKACRLKSCFLSVTHDVRTTVARSSTTVMLCNIFEFKMCFSMNSPMKFLGKGLSGISYRSPTGIIKI